MPGDAVCHIGARRSGRKKETGPKHSDRRGSRGNERPMGVVHLLGGFSASSVGARRRRAWYSWGSERFIIGDADSRRSAAAQCRPMTNLASLLKSEISRVARKEIRTEILPLKKTVAAQRAEIATLKRDLKEAQQQLRRLGKAATKAAPRVEADAPGKLPRFSAKGFRALRARLALSAKDCGLLVGASGQAVYLWEKEMSKPRPRLLKAIAALRTMGKKEAAERAAALRAAA